MSAHARLSPSGAHRWMPCPGSVVLEAEFPNDSSVYANEGTLAHTLAAGHLQEGWNLDAYIGEGWRFEDGTGTVITKDMVDHVKGYCDRVRNDAIGGILEVEQRLSIEYITGEPEAAGTSDIVIIKPGELIVIDLKFGMGEQVFAEGNEQLYFYAASAMHAYEMIYDFDKITVVIDQPRLHHRDSHTISVVDLKAFIGGAQFAAERAVSATLMDGGELLEQLHPGEKQCRFCRAKSVCPALRDNVRELTGLGHASANDFSDLVVPDSDVGDNYLSMAMAGVGLVEHWCKAVRAETERRLIAGQKVDGFKLVKGKKGPRKWIDDAQAEARLKAMRLKVAEMYKLSVISPTQADKLLGTRYQKLADLVTQSDGNLSVAPVTDPRPEERAVASAEDFSDLVK